ncbi:MAG: hypothetical protein MUC87_20780 [Bacteroidia bacterium]|jgi:hypothetical protein|nr:hypothetical protein [Bacteroidia bacterium]
MSSFYSRFDLRGFIGHIVVLFTLLPLFFINIKSSCDWGDDFAQYLHQAQHIISGESQNETGYIFNQNYPDLGPQAYPAGFPLLLAPVIYFKGLDIISLNLYITLFWVLCCFTGYLLLRTTLSYIPAMVIMLIIAYNPLLLQFKTEIVSDLPFTLISMLSIYLMFKKESLVGSILICVLIALSLHIRLAGLPLVLVFVLNKFFLEKHWKAFSFRTHKNTFIALLAGVTVYLAIYIGFPCEVNYKLPDESGDHWKIFNDHLSYTVHQLSWMFRWYDMKEYSSIGILTSCSLLIFSLLGMLYTFRNNKKSLLLIYTAIYLFMIFYHRSGHQGMRFIYPVLFILFLFAAIGLRKNLENLNWTKHRWIAIISGALILFSYNYEVEKIILAEDSITDGPQTREADSLFAYIHTSLPPKSIVAFDKPRALALYTQVHSFALNPVASDAEIRNDLNRLQAAYILTSQSLSTDNIRNFPLKDTASFTPLFSSSQFRLYRYNRAR